MTAEEKSKIAVLESRFETFERRFDEERGEAKAHREKLSSDVQAIRDVLTSVGGGWKAIVLVGAISAAMGGLVVKLLPFLAK